MSFTEFHFLRPGWLLALLPLAGALWLMLKHKRSRGNWGTVCDKQLLPHILLDRPLRQDRWPLALFALGGLLAILALAGPTWERLPVPVFRNEAALVIALDLSLSMDAADIKPTRLERARYKIADILNQRKDGQTALLVYAGDAFTVTPLTDDTETIKALLAALSTSLMPSQGNRAGRALELGAELLKQAGLQSGGILLITDGVELDSALEAVRELKAQGYRLSVLGVGTREGAPIPLRQGGFLKDSAGDIVLPKLKAADLQRLAAEGGGVYHRLTVDNTDIETLSSVINQRPLQNQARQSDQRIERWREQGPWLLILLLPIAVLAFRRGYLVLLIGFLLLPYPKAQALDWENLWTTRDQQAQRLYQEGQIERAAELFKDPGWKAAAQYAAGHYEKAAQTLEGLETSESFYNKGNALARLGRYREAIRAYDQALQLDPRHEDAHYNKDLLEKQLQQASPPQSSKAHSSAQQGSEKEREQDGQNGQSAENPPAGDPQGQGGQRSEAQDSQAAGSDRAQSEPHQAQERAQEDFFDRQKASGEETDGEPKPSVAEADRLDELQQANEQWLRRIPDDPGGLLRRKFYYQYQQRNRQRSSDTEPW